MGVVTASWLTNREIATLVLLGALLVGILVLALRKERLRNAFGGLFRSFVRPHILFVLVGYYGCLLAAVFLASRLGLWEWGLWKPTGVWMVLSGFGLLFKYDEVVKQPGFGWRVSVRTIALVEIVSFVADVASFPLWIEIPAQALAFIAGVMSAWAGDNPEHAPIARLANRYLMLFGVAALLAGIRSAATGWENLDHGLLIREFLVPIWLTPVALVCVYAFAIYCVYEVAFKQMALVKTDRNLFRQRLAVVLRVSFIVSRVRVLRRVGGTRFAHANGFRDAWNELGEILRRDERARSASVSPRTSQVRAGHDRRPAMDSSPLPSPSARETTSEGRFAEMSTDDLDPNRHLAFINETETAVALLDEGIGRIASWHGGEDRRIVALHLLAQGFERFLILTHALLQLSSEGALPTRKQVEDEFWHDLARMLDEIVEAGRRDDTYIARPAIQNDIDFLANDEHWREVLSVLSDLCSGGRYHDLDTMLDGQSAWQSPMDRWQSLEMAYCRTDPQWLELMKSNAGKFHRQWYPALAAKQTETLQRAARGVARIWTLGPARAHGQKMSSVIGRFLFIMDDDLGAPAT